MYSLHKGIGTTIPVPDAENSEHTLKVAGMFDGSVFQGVLLMSEENFLKVYPEEAGYSYFLVETPLANANSLTNLLETGLTEFGFDAERVADRLANFLAVQNTYLSTFQTLGGLGLLLGTLGLSTVMLRNVLERRSEIALLRSVGFTNSAIGWLVMLENAFLLVWGLIAGTVSALLSMLPHLLSTGADVPWASGAVILVSVFCIGMLAALVAVREAMSTPLVTSLRSE
jgi:ABC-type antimicrobial peptide transport system permease subunit